MNMCYLGSRCKILDAGYRIKDAEFMIQFTFDVIPAQAGIHLRTKPGFPRIKYGAGLVKPGMTKSKE